MATLRDNPFISTSFTLRPPTDDADEPELTLYKTPPVSRRILTPAEDMMSYNYNIDRQRCGNEWTREGANHDNIHGPVKRQRLFHEYYSGRYGDDGALVSSTAIGSRYQSHYISPSPNYKGYYDYYYRSSHATNRDSTNQNLNSSYYYSTQEEQQYTSSMSRRVSIESKQRYQPTVQDQQNYWRNRCLQMKRDYGCARNHIYEMEIDKLQLQERVDELEEQLLVQTSRRLPHKLNDTRLLANQPNPDGDIVMVMDDDNIEGLNHGNLEIDEDDNDQHAKVPMVVEIRESYQKLSTLLYFTDGEGLLEESESSFDEDDENHSVIASDAGVRTEETEDRNDVNKLNQARG